MLYNILLSPPIVFLIVIIVGAALTKVAGRYAPKSEVTDSGKFESYACGQKDVVHNASPDYKQFFPYAFFFTIMHVLVLVIATAPRGVLTLPLLYVVVGILALVLIFRR